METIRKQFSNYRKMKKVNQTNLALWSKVSRTTIWRFENGKVDIGTESLERLLDSLDCKIIIVDKNV